MTKDLHILWDSVITCENLRVTGNLILITNEPIEIEGEVLDAVYSNVIDRGCFASHGEDSIFVYGDLALPEHARIEVNNVIQCLNIFTVFERDFQKHLNPLMIAKSKAQLDTFREELMMRTWHPSRLFTWNGIAIE